MPRSREAYGAAIAALGAKLLLDGAPKATGVISTNQAFGARRAVQSESALRALVVRAESLARLTRPCEAPRRQSKCRRHRNSVSGLGRSHAGASIA